MHENAPMPVTIKGSLPPQLGSAEIEINIRVQTTLNITPVVARRKINVLMLERIGNLLHGGSPELFLTDRVFWRTPVVLSTPSQGQIGRVGHIDVDAETGEMIVDDSLLKDMAENAKRLLVRS